MTEQAIIYFMSVAPFVQTAVATSAVVIGVIGFIELSACTPGKKEDTKAMLIITVALIVLLLAAFTPQSDHIIEAKEHYQQLCE